MSQTDRHMRIVAVLCISSVLLAGAASVCAAPAGALREAELIKTIKGNASQAEKDKACRELQIIGTQACIPALADLLTDAKLSHLARCALEPMPYPQAGQALRDALGKAGGPTRVGIITSLGFRADAQAAGALAQLLSDRDEDIAGAAAAALGRIGTTEAASALATFRASAKGPLRGVAAEASLIAAEQLVRQGRTKDAAAICEDLQGTSWPAHVRLGAFVTLLSTGGDDALARSAAAIAGKDAALRAAAIANIPTLKGTGVGTRLVGTLPTLPPYAQALLIEALAKRGDTAVRSEIAKAAGSSSPEVRTAAVRALGRIGDAGCTLVLCKAVAEGKSPAEKEAAVNSLQVLPGETVNPTLLAYMKTAEPAVRVALIDTLAIRKAGGIVKDLLAEAKGPDASVRAAATKALGQLASASDLPALVGLLVAPKDGQASPEAERAVVLVSRKISQEAAQADAVLAALETASATPVRCSLLKTLGGIGNGKAFQAVTAALKDTAPAVQDAAVRALASWPDARVLDALLGVFRTAKSMTHRVLALRGCVRLVGLSDRSAGDKLKVFAELMKGAPRSDDKKLVLSGLAGVADPAALAAVEPFLDDRQVKNEAELAILGIARGLRTTAPDKARAALQKLQGKARNNRTLRRDISLLLRQIDAQPAWTPLFNGKDLTGWTETGDAIFKVEDGNLIGTQTTGKGGDLWTKAEFDDFEMQVTYRVVWPANSGFWFRHNGQKGYQYDVLKYTRPVAFSGTLYCPGKMFIIKNLKESLENRDGWNEARVVAVGSEITLWLNGTKTGTVKDTLLTKGKIGIQVHGGNFKGMKIIIKKMVVRSLKK